MVDTLFALRHFPLAFILDTNNIRQLLLSKLLESTKEHWVHESMGYQAKYTHIRPAKCLDS